MTPPCDISIIFNVTLEEPSARNRVLSVFPAFPGYIEWIGQISHLA